MEAIERISVTDAAVQKIRAELISGKFSIGDKLPTEKALSETLGVGRSTVREAVRMLQAMGFVEIRPGRGAFVSKVTVDTDDSIREWFARYEFELSDFFSIRTVIEPLAVRQATERATEKDIEKIGRILESFFRAMDAKDVVELAAMDEAFHNAIAAATHNDMLIAINRQLAGAFKPYRLRSFALAESASNAIKPHQDILNALKRRDSEAGVAAMQQHLAISIEDVRKAIGG